MPAIAFIGCALSVVITTWGRPAGALPFAYITNTVDDTVSVIDTADNTVVAAIALPAGNSPSTVAVTPAGNRVYVGNQVLNDTVFVIDAATKTVVDTVPSTYPSIRTD